jgi:hypothetical protein
VEFILLLIILAAFWNWGYWQGRKQGQRVEPKQITVVHHTREVPRLPVNGPAYYVEDERGRLWHVQNMPVARVVSERYPPLPAAYWKCETCGNHIHLSTQNWCPECGTERQ